MIGLLNSATKKANAIKIILIAICCFFTETYVLGQNQAKNSPTVLQLPSDTVFVFQKNAYQQAIVLENNGKKIKVRYVNEFSSFTHKLKLKYVFTPISKHSQPFPTALRFRYADEITADDIIVKGTVIGFNSNYFLLELSINNSVKVVMKHKSEIVQNDLKTVTPEK
jgi:hypothetical protein